MSRKGPTECSVPDCGRPPVARGLCQGHYQRARRTFMNLGADPTRIEDWSEHQDPRLQERLHKEPRGDEQVAFRLAPDIYARLAQEAERRGQSLYGFARSIIEDWVTNNSED